jgi:NIPSNAP protein
LILEIRTYRVVPGRASEFVRLMQTEALPLLDAQDIDVVACGVSLDPRDGDPLDAYLIRAFEDEANRARCELAFYASDEWRDGPRAAVLALIESFHTVVLEVPDSVVDALRR